MYSLALALEDRKLPIPQRFLIEGLVALDVGHYSLVKSAQICHCAGSRF